MRENYLKINLAGYLPLDSYTTLDPNFRKELFKKLIMKFDNVTNLANVINVNRTSVYDWSKGRVRAPFNKLIKCIKLINITENRLLKSISYITTRYEGGKFFVEDWRLILDDELSEWLGLLKGDGYVSSKYVGCTNASVSVSLFFMKILEKILGVPKSNITIMIEIPQKRNLDDALPVIDLLNNKGYKRITKRNHGKGNKILLSPRVNSKALAQLLRKLMGDLYWFIENSIEKVKIGYVRGFAAAEGSIHQSGGLRAVSFSNKDLDELKFVKRLLHGIGVVHVSDPESDKKGVYKIKITTQPQLRLFHEKIGFGKHEERNRKLTNILGGYKKILTRVEYNRENVRRDQILKTIKKKGKVNAKEIASEIDVSYTRVNKLLKKMLNERLIYKVEGWPYTYCSKI